MAVPCPFCDFIGRNDKALDEHVKENHPTNFGVDKGIDSTLAEKLAKPKKGKGRGRGRPKKKNPPIRVPVVDDDDEKMVEVRRLHAEAAELEDQGGKRNLLKAKRLEAEAEKLMEMK
jgi:hypothetical protein